MLTKQLAVDDRGTTHQKLGEEAAISSSSRADRRLERSSFCFPSLLSLPWLRFLVLTSEAEDLDEERE